MAKRTDVVGGRGRRRAHVTGICVCSDSSFTFSLPLGRENQMFCVEFFVWPSCKRMCCCRSSSSPAHSSPIRSISRPDCLMMLKDVLLLLTCSRLVVSMILLCRQAKSYWLNEALMTHRCPICLSGLSVAHSLHHYDQPSKSSSWLISVIVSFFFARPLSLFPSSSPITQREEEQQQHMSSLREEKIIWTTTSSLCVFVIFDNQKEKQPIVAVIDWWARHVIGK